MWAKKIRLLLAYETYLHTYRSEDFWSKIPCVKVMREKFKKPCYKQINKQNTKVLEAFEESVLTLKDTSCLLVYIKTT